jgi:hypothetical protein
MEMLRRKLGKVRKDVRHIIRSQNAAGRVLPQLLIIGGQRCGTTAFFYYLAQHPDLTPPTSKEVHYFDLNYDRGLDWYRAFFPRADSDAGRRTLSYDNSPYYIFHPAAAQRAQQLVPDAKIIALLREPVSRAYSHYWHQRRANLETLSFAEALAAEDARLAGEEERLLADPGYRSDSHRNHSYRSRGLYAQQLQRWFDRFPREQFLILKSEDFFADPSTHMGKVLQFLGLSQPDSMRYEAMNVGQYSELDPAIKEELDAFYRPHNAALRALTGEAIDW